MNFINLFLVTSLILPMPVNAKAFNYLDLKLSDKTILKSPDKLKAEDVKSDVELLLYGLREGYGGFKYLPKSEIEGVNQSLAKIANDRRIKSVADFCDQIGDAMWILQDNHIRAKLGDTTCGPKKIAAHRIGTVGVNFGKAESDKTKKPFVIQVEQFRGRKVAKLSITAFPFHEDSAWNGFDEALDVIKASDAFILDLRGNGGGDDSRGYQLAEMLIGSKVTPDWDTTIKRQTPETLTLFRNMFVYSKMTMLAKGQTPEAYLDERIKETDAKIELAANGKLPAEERIDYKPVKPMALNEHSYRGPIFLLVDASCASSCESSMNTIKLHPHARTVGENTAGYFHFGDVGKLVLPKSKIVLMVPTKSNMYASGKIYDKVGFPPDIRVPQGEDAMRYAMDGIAIKK